MAGEVNAVEDPPEDGTAFEYPLYPKLADPKFTGPNLSNPNDAALAYCVDIL